MNSSISSIIIRQNRESTEWFRAEPPKWQYVSPTPELEQQGLTPNKLREIIDSLNRIAEDAFNSYVFANGYGRAVILISFIGLFVVTVANFNSHPFAAQFFVMFIIGILAIGMFAWWVKRTDAIAVRSASEMMRIEVEDKLNEEWQHSHGIRWDILSESRSIVRHDNDGTTSTLTIWYYDISVRSLKPAIVPVSLASPE